MFLNLGVKSVTMDEIAVVLPERGNTGRDHYRKPGERNS